ncbi:MAG: aminodeoxychorismate/anthranilate synthase component II [Hyphomonas sp.]|nr:aminodeoxychorismate/anthranilate synthase component II [Hyphomonas sp.]
MRVLLIDNYDSFTYNLVHYVEELGAQTDVVRNDAITVDAALNRDADAILLSPGPCTPNEAGICLDLIRACPPHLPLLGVCLGHQAIGQAFGGTVARAKAIMHGKVSTIRTTKTGLFDGLTERFEVARYHSLAVLEDSLPPVLQANAWTDDGQIMAMQHVSRPIYGVQFHPESIVTEHGHAMIANFLKAIPAGVSA